MIIIQSPFERLRKLLAGLEPGMPAIDLTVGTPGHAPPAFIADVIAANMAGFRPYPPIGGTPAFQTAVRGWINRRYGLDGALDDAMALLPVNGSREGLFFAALTARDLLRKSDPAVLFANPFYQTYPAAAHAIGARAVPLAAVPGSALPDFSSVPEATLDAAIAYYIASPTNPEGLCASKADWHALFDLALRHDFFLIADECYSEIYREAFGPPPGALEAVRERPEALSRLLAFNSLSKRSNLAGMRVGFVAGDEAVISAMKDFRNQAAPQVPGPLQAAAAAAFDDEAHVIENRRLYDEKFASAEALLRPGFGAVTPPAGFCLWLAAGGDDEVLVRALWEEVGVRALPGSYLATDPPSGPNPGRGHIRFALVGDAQSTHEAFVRTARFFGNAPALAATG